MIFATPWRTRSSSREALLLAAQALLCTGCSAEVERSPDDDLRSAEVFPCEVDVAAELVVPAARGVLDDLIRVGDGYALSASPWRRDAAFVTRLSAALEPMWTIELATARDNGEYRRGGTLLAAADDGGLFVASVVAADDDAPQHVELRRVDREGATTWAVVLDDTAHHALTHLSRHDGAVTLVVRNDPPSLDVAVMKIDDDGNPLWRADPLADRNEITRVHQIAVGRDGEVVLAGQEHVDEIRVAPFATALSASGVLAWRWSDDRSFARRSDSLLARFRNEGWVVTSPSADGVIRSVAIDAEGNAAAEQIIEDDLASGSHGPLASRGLVGGDVLVAAHRGYGAGGGTSVIRLDATLGTVWVRHLAGEVLPSVLREGDDGALVVGGWHDGLHEDEQGMIRAWGLDAGGSIRWRWDAPGDGLARPPILHPEPDGSVVIAAALTREGSGATFVRRLVERCPR